MMQKLTTTQPDDEMVEVALIALKAALGETDAVPEHLRVQEETAEAVSEETDEQA